MLKFESLYFYSCFNQRFPILTSFDPEYTYEKLCSEEWPQYLLCTEDAIFDQLTHLIWLVMMEYQVQCLNPPGIKDRKVLIASSHA